MGKLKQLQKIKVLILVMSLQFTCYAQNYHPKFDSTQFQLYLFEKKVGILDSLRIVGTFPGSSYSVYEGKIFVLNHILGSQHLSLFYLNVYEIKQKKIFPAGYISFSEDDSKLYNGIDYKISDSVLSFSYSLVEKNITKTIPLNATILKDLKEKYALFREEILKVKGSVKLREHPLAFINGRSAYNA
jgi:hypothetical protein